MFPETTPALANVLHWASRPTDDAETRRLIQRRLMVYVRLIVIFAAGLYVAGLVGTAILVPHVFVAIHIHPAKVVNLLVAVGALVFLQALRRSEPREGTLRVFDIGFAFLLATGIGVAGATAP